MKLGMIGPDRLEDGFTDKRLSALGYEFDGDDEMAVAA